MKISLITVCFNSAATLPSTFASVLAQEGAEIDYHVVDGASKDDTVALLREWEPKFAAKGIAFTWTSEPGPARPSSFANVRPRL